MQTIIKSVNGYQVVPVDALLNAHRAIYISGEIGIRYNCELAITDIFDCIHHYDLFPEPIILSPRIPAASASRMAWRM